VAQHAGRISGFLEDPKHAVTALPVITQEPDVLWKAADRQL
jgi:hypothetical protein